MALCGKRLRKARKNGGFDKFLTMEKVIHEKGCKCIWCGRECKVKSFHVVGGQPQPNPDCATIEHIQAIANGGQHNLKNVAIACHACNSKKSDTDLNKWIVMNKVG